jgi:hypothetical protein
MNGGTRCPLPNICAFGDEHRLWDKPIHLARAGDRN